MALPPNFDFVRYNPKTYLEDKAAGNVSIIAVQGVPFYVRKAFNPTDGTPMPAPRQIDREQLAQTIAEAQALIISMQSMITDIDAL